jgi:hypothetical protein
MGKTCGRSFCGTLSYDFAFLGVMRMALTDSAPEFEKRRCMAHPFRKRVAVKTNESLVYCSAAAALLGYGKCRDDISDEKGRARIKARLALPYFASARKRRSKECLNSRSLTLRFQRGLQVCPSLRQTIPIRFPRMLSESFSAE